MTGNKLSMATKSFKNQDGITLLELVVSVTIFSTMIMAAAAIFQMVIEAQRNAIAGLNVQESMRYTLEVMSKETRAAMKDTAGTCAVWPGGMNRIYFTAANELKFRNKYNECVRYYLSGNTLMVDRGANTASTTPNEIRVTSLKFSVADAADTQSRATMLMNVEAIGKGTQRQPLKIQTTISSRNYE